MKFSINQAELQNSLVIVQKGITNKSTMPVLSGIYAEAKGDEVTFQSTDLELSIQYTVMALVEEEGKAVFPGKLISDIVKNLPDAAVHVEADEESAIVSCESSSFSIRCLNPVDFPAFPEILPEQSVSVPFDDFSTMARKVCRVVSRDESRAILTGVYIAVEEGTLKLVATDSYRLAMTQLPLEGQREDFNAVVAGSFMSDLASLPKTGEDITLSLAENQIIVSYGGTVFINRRIEGRYPNYKQLIPSSYETRCIVDRAALSSAVKRASLLDHSGSQVRVSISAESQSIQLSTSQDAGSTQELVRADVEGADVEIGFNSHYMNEGLAAMDSSRVFLEIQGPLKPGIMKGDEGENYLYLVMPVRI
ncbi:MAG TPA: DNA polymerase III subunit beta [Eggerthellaceae bacterium]|nr:DNA polymerase III subunit beta [Eggerthellaceae bacterium]